MRESPVRVLRLIARLNVGGPAIHTVLLTRGLDAGRFTSVLVTGTVGAGEGDMTGYARQRGVHPVVIQELCRNVAPWKDAVAFVKILRFLWSFRPDIIHTHTAKAGALGRLAGMLYNAACWLRGAPRARLIHTFHGHLFHGYFPPLPTRVLVWGERILARLTDRIVTISAELKRELTEVYRISPPKRVVVIPLGIDLGWADKLAARRGQLRTEFGLGASSLAVGIVGRLTQIKNHDLFLQAARACGVPGARFVVIGDGERGAQLKALSDRLGLDGRVVFTGWQNDPAKIYADLDIACLTSHNEGTPLALIEAMAAGVPVTATRVGGIRDLMVGEGTLTSAGFEVFANGILVPPDDAAALAAAVAYLAERPESRRAMGAAGRVSVQRRFSIERLLSETERLYVDVVGR